MQTDPVNGTTAFLGDTQLRVAPGATAASASRAYTFNGVGVAERNTTAGVAGSTLYFLDADPLGTATVEVRATDGKITRRYEDPFGVARGTAVTWSSARGFLNAPTSSFSELTQLGARAYDASIGRFLSVDPLLDVYDPGSIAAYAYANNSPVTNSDPSGLCTTERDDGKCTSSRGATKSSGWFGNFINRILSAARAAGSAAAGTGTGSLARPVGPFPTSGSDRTTRHNAARDEAAFLLVEQKGLDIEKFNRRFRIDGAAKRCMFKNPCTPGVGLPDLVHEDTVYNKRTNEYEKVYNIWEVKAASIDGANVVARTEALWYRDHLRAQGLNAELGETYPAPGVDYLGDTVYTPEPGVILYGRDESDSQSQGEGSSRNDSGSEDSGSLLSRILGGLWTALSRPVPIEVPVVPVP